MAESLLKTQRPTIVFGAGGHGRVVGDALIAGQGSEALAGFVDDDAANWGLTLLKRPILGRLETLAPVGLYPIALGIGNNSQREGAFQRAANLGFGLVTIQHPSAVIGSECSLGTASVVLANVVVNSGTRVGSNVILNTACSVDHDCDIGDHVHIGPGARLAGGVCLGSRVLIGMGALLLPGVQVGSGTVVGAGAVVARNLPANCVALGAPARVRRFLAEGELYSSS